MDSQKQRRPVQRKRVPSNDGKRARNGERQICLPLSKQQYDDIWNDSAKVRIWIDQMIKESPELFPEQIADGYHLKGKAKPSVKMPDIQLRQIEIGKQRYYLRPSFVMPAFSGTTDELEAPMELLAHGIPLWLVVKVFGHNEMFWLRQMQRLGRNSIVGSTVREPESLPKHLAADEHHGHWRGEKGYIATTASEGCLLGVALTDQASDKSLTEAYGVFQKEATELAPSYKPVTVNTDGWFSTQNAFQALFPGIVTILCFLHGFLKVRERGRSEHELHERIWEIYHSTDIRMFDRRMKAFRKWFESHQWSKSVSEMTAKLWKRADQYRQSFKHAGCYRTSNQVDRLMNRMTRLMYSGRGLHGNQAASESRLRGWALMVNFIPYAHRSNVEREFACPAHRLSGKNYSDNWLENLLLSASMNGKRRA